jgi:hypothetical protein
MEKEILFLNKRQFYYKFCQDSHTLISHVSYLSDCSVLWIIRANGRDARITENTENPNLILYTPTAPLARQTENRAFLNTSHFLRARVLQEMNHTGTCPLLWTK